MQLQRLVLPLVAAASIAAAGSPQLVVQLSEAILSDPIPDDFVSISLETKCLGALWNRYVGSGGQPRASYARLMTLLQSQSGGRGPNIRVGGDSTDYSAWFPPGTVAASSAASALPLGIEYQITNEDFSAMQSVAAFNGTFTLGLNFLSPFWYNGTTFPNGAGPNGTAYGIQTLQGMIANGIPLTSPLLDTIELGNEPDIFWMTNSRPLSYSPYQFNEESAAYLDALLQTFPELRNRQIFQAGTFCCQGTASFNSTWLPSYLKQMLPFSKSFSYHNYPYNRIVDPWVSVYSLLAPQALSQNYENWTIAAINEVNAYNKAKSGGADVAFTVGEGNSIGSGGKANVSDVYGASLWFVDQSLYMASLGIKRWNVHGCDLHGFYSPVTYIEGPNQPDTPQVKPVFLGMWFAAQAMRKGAQLTQRQVSGDAASNPLISVWSLVDQEGMWRAVVLNKDVNATVATNATVRLPAGSKVPSSALVYRLKTTSRLGVLAQSGITFAGQTFDGNDDGTPVGTRTPEVVSFDAGSEGFSFTIAPAEAVILEVQLPPTPADY